MPTRYNGQGVDPSPLGEPLAFPFSTRVAPNRLMKAAITEWLATWNPSDMSESGIPDSALTNLYGHWGRGGWGVVVTGNIMIDPEHIESPGNMIISAADPLSGPRFEAYRRLARAGKSGSSVLLGQLNHPGRQVARELQADPVSASDVQLTRDYAGMRFARPHAASAAEIAAVRDAFVHAAVYLEAAGFDGVQLHGAHGYLLAQFLSPATNRRRGDAYGGGLENRARLMTEIADATRARTGPGFVLAVKINSVEFQDGGFGPADAAALVRLLEAHGFDAVELSGGDYEEPAWHHRTESTRRREAFFIEFAETIVPHVAGTRCFVTGGLRTVGAMVGALESGLDGVGLARPGATEPRLPREILLGGVRGCLKPFLSGDDTGIESVLAGAQMRLMALDREPIDPSDPEAMAGFSRDFAAWVEGRRSKTRKDAYGHVTIASLELAPYGVVEPAPI